MPNRTLKETITTSERLAAVSFEAESLFYRLLVCADDFGRFDARPIIVRSRAMPLRDVCLSDVGQWTDELQAHGLIVVYEVEGKPYLQIQRWEQRKRANKSKYPDPPIVAPKKSKSCGENDGQLTAGRQTNDSHPSPEERGTRSEERGEVASAKGSRLPADWVLPDDWRAWAQAERSDLDVTKTAADFADYWHAKPGKDGRKSDWLATWRRWVRNQYGAKSGANREPAALPRLQA